MIKWPEKYSPAKTRVHVHNELDMTVPPERVWAWLIRAKLWPTWYKNSGNVVIEGDALDLNPGAKFRWQTFGAHLQSQVLEFEPFERLAWNAKSSGIDAYHAWLIERTPVGCHVVTEENQNGWVAFMANILRPWNMGKYHQMWLEQLLEMAKSGSPL
jgi:uncharacterized protein YndB with AHSA1/START domain